jgi:hypothetical protein
MITMPSNPYEKIREQFGERGRVAYARCHNNIHLFCELMLSQDALDDGERQTLKHKLDRLMFDNMQFELVREQFL